MPVKLSESTASGFLREFNFHTLTQALISELLGEVKYPDWLKVGLSTRPDPLPRQFLFTIRVTLKAHRRYVDLGPSPRSPVNHRELGLKRGRTFVSEFPVPENVIQEFRGDLPKMYRMWVEQTLMGNAHRLYEADPRIGWRYGIGGSTKGLPRSRLFDPYSPFSRTGLPMLDAGSGELVESLNPPQCPFCQVPHGWSQPPVWAGANLLWVHLDCWRAS